MIWKMQEPYICCWGIQIRTEKDGLLLKWFQRWQNFTSLVGTFQIPTEKDSSVFKWFQRSQNLTSFVKTLKFQLKKTVQYRNDFKDDRTLHPLWGHSKANWKRQFSLEMISKIRKPSILCLDIQILTEKDSSVLKLFQRLENHTFFVGTFQTFQLKKTEFRIEIISKMTKPFILCGNIQIPNEKDSSVLK